jgi:Amt family ammonium transporter
MAVDSECDLYYSYVNVADSFEAATVVGLQSVPGLMVIYGGLVKTKWAINSAFMVFYAFAAVMVCWGVWAYQMSFGDHMIPGLVGIPRPILSSMSELKQVCEDMTTMEVDFV